MIAGFSLLAFGRGFLSDGIGMTTIDLSHPAFKGDGKIAPEAMGDHDAGSL